MKLTKRILSVLLAVLLIAACFAGCSSKTVEKYDKETCIIGYTELAGPFITAVNDGEADGFCADLWKAIFDSVKGDLKTYRFEEVEAGYTLEEDGGFFDSANKEYSACLMLGAVSKNYGTFNEDYSYTEPIITNRVVAVVPKDSSIKTYADFAGARAGVVSNTAKAAFEKQTAISSACQSVSEFMDIQSALDALDNGALDVVVTDEFTYLPVGLDGGYTTLNGELDTIEYVIACAKNSGWKDSINEAIREMKSESYGDGDEFTPLVERHFGYNASSFNYTASTDK